MKRDKYMGLDVHQAMTVVAVILHIPDDATYRAFFMHQRIVVSAHPVTAGAEEPSRHPACHRPEFTTPASLPP